MRKSERGGLNGGIGGGRGAGEWEERREREEEARRGGLKGVRLVVVSCGLFLGFGVGGAMGLRIA